MKYLTLLSFLFLSEAALALSPVKYSFQELTTKSTTIVIGTITRVDLVNRQGKLVLDSESMTDEVRYGGKDYGVDDVIRFHLNIEESLKSSNKGLSSSTRTVGLGMRHMSLGLVKDWYEGKRGILFLTDNVNPANNQSINFNYTSLRYLTHPVDRKNDVLMHLFCNEYGC